MHVSYAGLELLALPLEGTFTDPPLELRPRLPPLPPGTEEGAVLVRFRSSLPSLGSRRGAAAPCVRLPLGVRGGPAACVVSSSARAYRARGKSSSKCLHPMMSGSGPEWEVGGALPNPAQSRTSALPLHGWRRGVGCKQTGCRYQRLH